MKNKFNETGSDFGKTHSEPKLKKNELTSYSTLRKEQIDKLKFLILLSSNSLKGGPAELQLNKMDMEITIKGKPVIDIFESFDGSYWFVTEKAYKQDSVIDGKLYQNDQIFFGYVRLSSCPECAEFGYFSEAELKQLGSWVWKVPKRNWIVCPEVEIKKISSDQDKVSNKDRDIIVSRPALSC
jgi:hypothetical protein